MRRKRLKFHWRLAVATLVLSVWFLVGVWLADRLIAQVKTSWIATPAPGLPAPHRHSVVHHGAAHTVLLNGHLYHVRLDKTTMHVSRIESIAAGPPHKPRVEKAATVLDLACHQGRVTETLVWQGDWPGADEDFEGMVREAVKQTRQP